MAEPYRCAFWEYDTGSRVIASEPEHADLSDEELRQIGMQWAERHGLRDSGCVVIGRTDE